MQSSYTAAYRREPAWVTQPSVLSAIALRPKMLLLISMAMFGLFAWLILHLPKGYESHMKLRLAPGGDGHIPTASEARTTSGNKIDTLDSRMKLEMEVLRSTDTLTQVALKAGLQKVEVAQDQGIGETSPLTIQKAVQRLQENLKIKRVGDSNILEISYSGPTSELATATLECLAAVYPKARLNVYGEPGNYKFLHRQGAMWRQQLDEAENDLVHFRRRYSEFVLPEERDALGKQAVEAQAAFEQADAQVAQYKKKVAEAQKKLKALSPSKAEQNRALLNSEVVGRTVMMLADLIGRKADVDNRVALNGQHEGRPGDVDQRPLDERIRSLKVTLSHTLSQASRENPTDLNPVHQSAEATLVASETELAGLQALRDRLKQIAEAYKMQMFRLADAEVRDAALLRQVKQTEEQYLLYTKWQEQAITAENLAKEDILNFGVVQRPTIPLEPSTPHIGIDLGLSFLLSVCCGLAAVLCAENLTPTALRRYAAVQTIPAHFEVI